MKTAIIILVAALSGCTHMIDVPQGQSDVGKLITAGGSMKLILVTRPTGKTGAVYISDKYGINTNYMAMPPNKLRELKKLIDKTLDNIENKK